VRWYKAKTGKRHAFGLTALCNPTHHWDEAYDSVEPPGDEPSNDYCKNCLVHVGKRARNSNWPQGRTALIAKGFYRDKNRVKQTKCRGPNCTADIEWWITPRAKRIPLNAADLSPHHATCPDVEMFRLRGRKV
jgi:hypothetical protein